MNSLIADFFKRNVTLNMGASGEERPQTAYTDETQRLNRYYEPYEVGNGDGPRIYQYISRRVGGMWIPEAPSYRPPQTTIYFNGSPIESLSPAERDALEKAYKKSLSDIFAKSLGTSDKTPSPASKKEEYDAARAEYMKYRDEADRAGYMVDSYTMQKLTELSAKVDRLGREAGQ